MTPASRQAFSARAVWAGVPPTGFSQKTCLPAAAAASTISQCTMLGAQTATTSTSGWSTAARQSSVASRKPKSSNAAARRCARVSAHTVSSAR